MSTQEERVMDKLNYLYASIKRVYLDLLLKKVNNPDYIGANFYDAMQLSITSNSLSLIKGFMQNNHYSNFPFPCIINSSAFNPTEPRDTCP